MILVVGASKLFKNVKINIKPYINRFFDFKEFMNKV